MQIDPARCPLCQRANACAMAGDGCSEAACGDCWCAGVTIPAAVLARVPATARDRACICAPCARGEPAPVQERVQDANQEVGRARD